MNNHKITTNGVRHEGFSVKDVYEGEHQRTSGFQISHISLIIFTSGHYLFIYLLIFAYSKSNKTSNTAEEGKERKKNRKQVFAMSVTASVHSWDRNCEGKSILRSNTETQLPLE